MNDPHYKWVGTFCCLWFLMACKKSRNTCNTLLHHGAGLFIDKSIMFSWYCLIFCREERGRDRRQMDGERERESSEREREGGER